MTFKFSPATCTLLDLLQTQAPGLDSANHGRVTSLKYCIALGISALLAGCGQESKPSATPHLAPVTVGAIPEKIGGCGEGCEKLDKFAKWQPLLAPLVEMHRKQDKCTSVEYAMPDIASDPADPKFYVQCKDVKTGQLYNTYYMRAQIEAGKPATSEPVTRAHAETLCSGQLAEKLPGATVSNKGFYESPNGSVRLTYDLKVNGWTKKRHAS